VHLSAKKRVSRFPASRQVAGRLLSGLGICVKPEDTIGCGFEHHAFFYESDKEYVAAAAEFIEAGLSAGERVLVSVPSAKHGAMRASLNGGVGRVEFWNMNELGRNPGRIIPAVREWIDRGEGRCRFIGEPIWPGRSATEIVEATRHEALINLAFADADATILCPYDVAGLGRDVLFDAERTHPELIRCGHSDASEHYADPVDVWLGADWELPSPTSTCVTKLIGSELCELRDLAGRALRGAGLGEDRVLDVVLAIDEAATNALVHGRGPAQLRIWKDRDELVCEIYDSGCLTEPLAGRRQPEPEWPSGRGVWMMNQLCDLVELRPTPSGTVVRLHVALGAQSSWTAG
jgi:anti-sigma regulatory factor (Ser/Thr protein kinase)